MCIYMYYIIQFFDLTIRLYTFRLGAMTRLEAAKELFNAFVTRTQAYRLHHSFGLTVFGDDVSVKLPITKNSEKFEVHAFLMPFFL